MNIPNDTKLFEHPIGTLWFDEDGILCMVSKPKKRDIEIMKDYINFIKEITDNQRVCLLCDGSRSTPMEKEVRDFVGPQLESIYKALVIISETAIGHAIGSFFLKLEDQPIPSAMFSCENQAKTWLKNYL